MNAQWTQIVDEVGPQFADGAAERDATDTFVADHYRSLHDRGLVTMQVPAELGGGGATHSEVGRTLRALARHDPATALALSMHQHLVAAQVFNHRQGKERATATLRRVAAESLVLISTGARDWLESNGTMRRVDGGYRVTARKAFASGSLAGHVAVTSAPYEHPEHGWQVLHFPVPMSADGVRVGTDWQAHGMRATGSHTIHFDDVFVPEAAVALARPRGGFHPVWNVVLTVAMPLIANVYVGVAQRAGDIARQVAARRASDVPVQWAAGEMESHRMTAEALGDRLLQLAADLEFTPSMTLSNEILAIKTATVAAARKSVEAAFEAAGGQAYYRRTGLEQLLRDVRAGDFHPLPAKAQTLFAGRLALGLPPTDG